MTANRQASEAPRPPKLRRHLCIASTGLILATLLASCGGGSDQPAPLQATATLSAAGAASQARISYALGSATPTEITVALPWSLDLPLSAGQSLSATASNLSDRGDVTLRISGTGISPVSGSGTTTAAVRYTCCD